MKVRQDFVTNSSSTSFGAATAAGIISAILTAVGVSASSAAEAAAGTAGEGGLGTAADGPDRDFDPESFAVSEADYETKQNKFAKEIEEYKKEWESTKDTLEGEDYEKTKQQYEEYIGYLENKKQEAENFEFQKQLEKIAQEAEQEYKQTWIEERKKDLENAREQIEFIGACINGYGKAGYEVEEAQRQLEMYKAKERDLDNALKKEGVEHNYQAKEREDIGPSKSVAELVKKVNEKYDKILEDLRKEKMDRKKKEIIERNIQAIKEESKAYMKFSNTADNYLKTAEAVQTAADIGVDALEKVTGPAGKVIKKAYVAGKGVGGGVGEAWADPENATSHIIKGSIKGAGDLAKEFTDNQKIKDGINIVSETAQGAIDSYQKGESPTEGIKKGLLKAGVEAVGDRLTDKFLPNSARDIDFGKYTGKEILKGVTGGNPTIKEFLKDSIKDSIKNNTINHVKNLPKGEGFVFGDLKAY